jgi:hypothetical protein
MAAKPGTIEIHCTRFTGLIKLGEVNTILPWAPPYALRITHYETSNALIYRKWYKGLNGKIPHEPRRSKMHTKTGTIRMLLAWLICLQLCACTSHANPINDRNTPKSSETLIQRLSQKAPILRKQLVHFKVLPKASKSPNQLAKTVFDMLRGPLQLRFTDNTADMEDLDLERLMRRKRGSCHDMMWLFAAFLQTCEVHTTVVTDDQTSLLLYEADSETLHTVKFEKKAWGVITICVDKSVDFAGAQQRGKTAYLQLQKSPKFQAVHLYQHWASDVQETLLTRLLTGIEHGQRGETKAATGYFAGVLKTDPKNAAAMNNLGNLALFQEDFDAAIGKYQQALKLDENDAEIFLNLGIAYYLRWKRASTQKQRQESEKQYQMAFDEAYRSVQSSANLLRYLGLDCDDEADAEYCWLIYDAENRVTDEEPQWRPIGGRGKQPEIPVYWKSF